MLRPVDKLWWFRFASASIVGITSGIMSFTGIVTQSTLFIPLAIVVAVYISTYYGAVFLLKITPDLLPQRRDIVLAGLFPYLFCCLTLWVLALTLLRWASLAG
jgi:hypothetical protein